MRVIALVDLICLTILAILVSGLSASSQQDLPASELLNRFSTSRSPSGKSEEPGDLLTRGKELATRCWEEDEEFMAKDKFAEWLGGQSVRFRLRSRRSLTCCDLSGAPSTKLPYAIMWTSLTSPVCD